MKERTRFQNRRNGLNSVGQRNNDKITKTNKIEVIDTFHVEFEIRANDQTLPRFK